MRKKKNSYTNPELERRNNQIHQRMNRLRAKYVNENKHRKHKKEVKQAYNRLFELIDNCLRGQANGGNLLLSRIYDIFNDNLFIYDKSTDREYLFNENFINWTHYEVTKKGPSYIRGYSSKFPNSLAIAHGIITGFVTADDIKNDLGISRKQAERLLNPVDDVVTNSNHMLKDTLFYVWHLSQQTNNGIKSYAVNNRPELATSVLDYLGFLSNQYKDTFNKKYRERHFTKYGQKIANKINTLTESNRKYSLLIDNAKNIAQTCLINSQIKLINDMQDYISNKDKLINVYQKIIGIARQKGLDLKKFIQEIKSYKLKNKAFKKLLNKDIKLRIKYYSFLHYSTFINIVKSSVPTHAGKSKMLNQLIKVYNKNKSTFPRNRKDVLRLINNIGNKNI